MDKKSSSKKTSLSTKQLHALSYLALGYTAVDVSEMINVSQQQICQWKKSPVFIKALDDIKRTAIENAEATMSTLALEAISIIRDLMISGNQQVRMKLAMFVLDRLEIGRRLPIQENTSFSGSGIDINLLIKAVKNEDGQ